jgi:predicted nucleotidyltransferase
VRHTFGNAYYGFFNPAAVTVTAQTLRLLMPNVLFPFSNLGKGVTISSIVFYITLTVPATGIVMDANFGVTNVANPAAITFAASDLTLGDGSPVPALTASAPLTGSPKAPQSFDLTVSNVPSGLATTVNGVTSLDPNKIDDILLIISYAIDWAMLTENDIVRISKKLTDSYAPLAVGTFGSYAIGSAREKSDLDLFVIKRNLQVPEVTVRAIRGLLVGFLHPMDIRVFTASEFEETVYEYLSFTWIVARQARLYHWTEDAGQLVPSLLPRSSENHRTWKAIGIRIRSIDRKGRWAVTITGTTNSYPISPGILAVCRMNASHIPVKDGNL